MTTAQILHVAVFGAIGNIGRLVVEQLLAARHTVTAYVPEPVGAGEKPLVLEPQQHERDVRAA